MGDALREIHDKSVIRSDFVLVFGDTVANLRLQDVLQEHKWVCRLFHVIISSCFGFYTTSTQKCGNLTFFSQLEGSKKRISNIVIEVIFLFRNKLPYLMYNQFNFNVQIGYFYEGTFMLNSVLHFSIKEYFVIDYFHVIYMHVFTKCLPKYFFFLFY